MQYYLWRAVDQHGVALDILVQERRDAKAAKRFFKRLLKGLQYEPRVIITDKLRSYGVAQRQMLPHVEHRQSRYLNNRAKTHIDRHDAENGRCSGSNRPSRRSTFSQLTRSFTTISIHADIDCQPRPTARSARWPSMSGGRRPAAGVWDNLPNIIGLPPCDLPQINVTMPADRRFLCRLLGKAALTKLIARRILPRVYLPPSAIVLVEDGTGRRERPACGISRRRVRTSRSPI